MYGTLFRTTVPCRGWGGGLVGRFKGNKVFGVIKRNDPLGLNVVDPQIDIGRLFLYQYYLYQ
jgi:hypothetical protein